MSEGNEAAAASVTKRAPCQGFLQKFGGLIFKKVAGTSNQHRFLRHTNACFFLLFFLSRLLFYLIAVLQSFVILTLCSVAEATLHPQRERLELERGTNRL
jgi:hypothetical protein